MPYPLDELRIEDVAPHLNFTDSELVKDGPTSQILHDLITAAIAHTETLCGTLTNPVAPEVIQAIKMLVAHLYENRETTIYGSGTVSSVPFGYDELILNFKAWAF
jgi:hypothetical protein